jgi:hypothetical protein
MYYPTFSRPMLDEMLADARNGIDEIDRRRWAVRTRATQAERVRLAFDKSDKDKNGGLDLDEFLAAVQDACDGGRVRAHASTPMPTLEELRHLFTSADADGNGVLDVDEFDDPEPALSPDDFSGAEDFSAEEDFSEPDAEPDDDPLAEVFPDSRLSVR